MIQSFCGSQAFSQIQFAPPCKGIQDSIGFWIPHNGFRIPDIGFQSLSVELGLWIPIICGIPDSLSCILYSGFQSLGFQISQPKYSLIPDSTNKNFPRFRNPDFSTYKIRNTIDSQKRLQRQEAYHEGLFLDILASGIEI